MDAEEVAIVDTEILRYKVFSAKAFRPIFIRPNWACHEAWNAVTKRQRQDLVHHSWRALMADYLLDNMDPLSLPQVCGNPRAKRQLRKREIIEAIDSIEDHDFKTNSVLKVRKLVDKNVH